MQLVRLGAAGEERPFVRAGDGTLYDLSGLTSDVDGAFLASGGIARAAAALEAGELPVADAAAANLRVGPPLAAPGKILCIGMNYRRHAEETGAAVPEEPVLFMKAPDVIVGPDDDVLIPRRSSSTDWEVELGVVIGKEVRYLDSVEEALQYVAGYVVSNDVSEREFQLHRGGQWDKGKNCETFNPLGPALVTADEVPDPQELGLRTWVNGKKVQDSSTRDMVFSVAEIIHYLSQFMVLRPGDLINTGTPEGVALGQPEPKPYLREGDVVELEIDGLGRQRQTMRQA
ncbi:fumarylacetoacetate hydrolase family protein [Amycolatopsis sp. FDAARGOS 1241]|uniref:fumarylacetoacetate hydrolase family protein n=1 Tax=Amycolatopsis sp. FDAARGOS 1241 TaxID=2778070 RepID=UPI00194F1899|nr:fumarylacetoacetate hydrolase family protein [Amycolatopsis sp. FDAARGOS 1241]QRP44446.1 fumarylacetoacetate hydrolase family protein [Amycolatopsis sp. FDAARGOS 1241]